MAGREWPRALRMGHFGEWHVCGLTAPDGLSRCGQSAHHSWEDQQKGPFPWTVVEEFRGQVNPPLFHTITVPVQTCGLREWAGVTCKHTGLCRRDWPHRSQAGMRTECSGFRRPLACGPEQSCCVPALSEGSTVVTMSDLFVRELATLGPRPLATSVMMSPLAGFHTPTFSRPSSFRPMMSRSKLVHKPLGLLKTIHPVNLSC